jgi:hypothetical protein
MGGARSYDEQSSQGVFQFVSEPLAMSTFGARRFTPIAANPIDLWCIAKAMSLPRPPLRLRRNRTRFQRVAFSLPLIDILKVRASGKKPGKSNKTAAIRAHETISAQMRWLLAVSLRQPGAQHFHVFGPWTCIHELNIARSGGLICAPSLPEVAATGASENICSKRGRGKLRSRFYSLWPLLGFGPFLLVRGSIQFLSGIGINAVVLISLHLPLAKNFL